MALFLMRRLRGEGLKQIGTRFGIQNYSSVSSAIERLKIKMKTDRKLKKRADKLLGQLHKNQGQTPFLSIQLYAPSPTQAHSSLTCSTCATVDADRSCRA